MPHYTGDLSRSWVIVPLLVMYLLDLGGVGFLGPDEPRYASIGREMARSGDWITPRLDGEPWFEKPPLLYWMTGAAFHLGLGEEMAPRLPVALLSLLFLVFFHWFLRREFGAKAAWYARIRRKPTCDSVGSVARFTLSTPRVFIATRSGSTIE